MAPREGASDKAYASHTRERLRRGAAQAEIVIHIHIGDSNRVTKTIDCFIPGISFPAISVTGDECALRCKHCSGTFLKHMLRATDPAALIECAQHLSDAGATGFLLTGGSDSSGKVPLAGFADAVKVIKETTTLKINAHVGLMPSQELAQMVSAGIDAFSVDVYGTDTAVRDTLGLSKRADDFLSVISDLRDLGAQSIAPHVCVGIERGAVRGEFAAIESLVPFAPEAVVIIALMPTKGTAFEGIPPPSVESTLDVIRSARKTLPESRLLLGCMRSRSARDWETQAVKAGINGIAMPSKRTMRALAKEGWHITEKRLCCAID